VVARLTIKLPEALRRQAKAVAALRGETVSEVVRAALEECIAEAVEETESVLTPLYPQFPLIPFAIP
jgi:hypothetical protein